MINGTLPTSLNIHLVLPELAGGAFGVVIMLLQPVPTTATFFQFIGASWRNRRPLLLGSYPPPPRPEPPPWNYGPRLSGLIFDALSLFFHMLLGDRGRSCHPRSASYLERENIRFARISRFLLFPPPVWAFSLCAGTPHSLNSPGGGARIESICSSSWPAIARESSQSSESALKYFLSALSPPLLPLRLRPCLRGNADPQ